MAVWIVSNANGVITDGEAIEKRAVTGEAGAGGAGEDDGAACEDDGAACEDDGAACFLRLNWICEDMTSLHGLQLSWGQKRQKVQSPIQVATDKLKGLFSRARGATSSILSIAVQKMKIIATAKQSADSRCGPGRREGRRMKFLLLPAVI